MRLRVFRTFLVVLGFLVGAAANGQDFPTKPIRLVVPYPPGGGAEFSSRALAQELPPSLGQQLLVDNRPGAGGNIGAEIAARAPADGHTLLMAAPPFAIGISLYPSLPYDPLRDFVPVGSISATQFMLVVHPSVPVNSVPELVAMAKARPGTLNFGSSGNGTTPHLAIELLKSMAGIDLVHVPYKGAAPAVVALLGGGVQLMAIDLSLALGHVRAGRLKALAVTGKQRSKLAPELPTVSESGLPGYEITSWYGIVAPKGTSGEIVAKLNAEIVRIFNNPATVEQLNAQGSELFTGTPQQFGRFIASEVEKYARVIKISGAKVD